MYNLAQNAVIKNLVFLVLATTDIASADELYEAWDMHFVLKDYKRPSQQILESWLQEFMRYE